MHLFYDFSGQSYSNSSPVLGEVNRRPFKGRQAVGGVIKGKHAVSHLLSLTPSPCRLHRKVTPPKTGGELEYC